MTARRPTPRPIFETPTVITGETVISHLWGDQEGAQYVSDKIFVSTDTLHVLEYQLAPGGKFLHSAQNPTLFAADVAYVCLEGELILCDVEHGEVRPIKAGQIGFFRRDTWHHAFNAGSQPVRVLEYFAPPPSRGTASTYGRTKPLLENASYTDNRWAGRWPQAQAEREATTRIRVIDESDMLWSLPDAAGSHLLGTAIDTEHLTVRRGTMRPGHAAEVQTANDEALLYVTEGNLRVFLPEAPSGQAWHKLRSGDAIFLPVGTRYQLMEFDATTTRYWLGSARPVPEGWQP